MGILKELFSEIIIPEAVFNELTTNERFPEEAAIIKESSFIKTVKPDADRLLDVFQRATGLDLGESEAILYADESKADLLMMDEAKGRSVAKQMNIRVIGTPGILQLANAKGLMSGPEVRHCVDVLRINGRHISEELIERLMETVK